MPEIGQALREARMRARIDISEIEAQTKIRAKYLRALENEEWDLLPGPTFVKSFLRTYAEALDLDGKALVEEYRLGYERPNEADLQPIVAASQRSQTGGRRGAASRRGQSAAARAGRRAGSMAPSRGYTIAIVSVSLLIVLLVVALLTSGSSNDTPTTSARTTTTPRHTARRPATHAPTTPTGSSEVVSLSIQPTGTVFVCLLGENGRKLIPGTTLVPDPTHPSTQPTFHAKRFMLTLGNNAVKLYIDGSLRVVPPSSKPIGYSITRAGGRRSLTAAEQPTCR